jgi:hypothetical protein
VFDQDSKLSLFTTQSMNYAVFIIVIVTALLPPAAELGLDAFKVGGERLHNLTDSLPKFQERN